MLKYEDVLNDKEINSLIDSIHSEPYMLNHSKRHIFKVIEYSENIARQLGCDDKFINNLKIAALLHDVGMTVQRKNHAQYSYEISKKYLDSKEINNLDKDEILYAIKKHSNAKESTSLMHQILVVADKMDIDKTRMMPKAYLNEYDKNLMYINKVEILIDEKGFNMKFNIKEGHFKDICKFLENWPKPITEIKRVAKLLGRDYHFIFNDKEEIFNNDIYEI